MKKLYLLSIFIFMYIYTSAMPALGDSILIIQPDGSSIYVYLQGDEFAHIMTTVEIGRAHV